MESSGESVSYLEGDASRSSLRSSLPGILEGEDRASAALYSASNGNWNGSQGLGSRGSGGRGGASWAPSGGSPGPSGADTSRCLRVVTSTGAPANEDVIRLMAEAYGEVASISRSLAFDGALVVAYYDSRAAVLAEHMMQGAEVGPGASLRVARLGGAEAAQALPGTGVLSVVSLGGAPLTLGELASLAGAFGEVAAITVDAARPNVARVEFCDEQLAALGLGAAGAPAGSPPGASKLATFGSSAALLAGLEAAGPSSSAAPAYAATLPFSASAPVLDALLQEPPSGGQGYGLGAGAGAAANGFPRSMSEAALGGRLARRPLEAGAEAERRVQQERLYALDIARIEAGEDKRTTLMIRNIPNKYTQKMLLALIEERFKGEFDFFYLPIDFKNKCNVGYAFINMARPACIPALVAELHGKRWPKFNSEKVCCITYGRIQGKAALVQHFQNSSLLHEDKRCRPILFRTEGDHAGEPELFPPEL
ncbi:hypothetical protein QBZ16_004971 [Prototheca wickerhamii]|uniref:Mei2-like C-terminal RNA recognition motif domain-containing protein n=1 Tax=Prototheca wickerhamii TaxID=3111 RepID=A0AAD9IJR9_PROWI|nr:hypothetical protein QBZ16_004971 [Prototheca wickerhamii]